MKIGFTGTQKGMSEYQKDRICMLLQALHPEEVHHGDCIGADADFHRICKNLKIRIVIHPPINNTKRAFCEGGEILKAKDYIERNHDIVDAVDVMIATPFEITEQLRSGTWATIRYTKKRNKTLHLILPANSGHLIN